MYTFDTPNPLTTVLDIPAGRVHLTATNTTLTTVDVQPANPNKSRDVTAADQTTVTYTDGTLHIHTAQPHNQLFGASGALHLTIHLPADSHLHATAGAAELRTQGRLGDVTFDGAYRQITVEQAASLRLTAVDGDVEVGRLAGPAQISTNRGDIRVTEATHGTVVLRTHSGAITIGAAPGVSATLDAGTSQGRISNTLNNNGSAELDIQATTSHGDIVASSR